MKTFTYKQAIEVLNKYFKGYKVLRKFDGIRELSILFRDENGKKWELLSTADPSDGRGFCNHRGLIF